MITNVDAVTVFNGRTDKATRRKIYIPTVIRVWSDDVQYKIRVPLIAVVQDNREYMRDLNYAKLDNEEAAKYWTIQKGDLVVRGEYAGDNPLLGEDEISAYAKEQGLDLIRVTEYADDTSGGSLYTRHWRIGGK